VACAYLGVGGVKNSSSKTRAPKESLKTGESASLQNVREILGTSEGGGKSEKHRTGRSGRGHSTRGRTDLL